MFNRQSILFIIVVTLSFIFINRYFEKRFEPNDLAQEQVVSEEILQSENIPTKLYFDKDKLDGFTYGFQCNKVFYTFRSEKTPTKYLYHNSKKLQKIEGPNSELLAYSDKVSPTISIPSDLTKTLYKPTLISLEEKNLSIDVESIETIDLKNTNTTHFLVITKTPNGAYPLGYWDNYKSEFYPIETMNHLSEFLTVISSTYEESKIEEELYLLENPYMQVAFSSIGGSVAEINLTFDSKEKQLNLIHPISYDEELGRENSNNNLFPLKSAWKINGKEKSLTVPYQGGYTPLLRRSLVNEDNETIFSIDPKYYAFSLLDEQDNISSLNHFEVINFDETTIEFQGEINGKRITKKYSLPTDSNQLPYCLECSITLDDTEKDLWLTSGILEVELLSNQYKPEMQAQTHDNKNKTKREKIKLPKETASIYHPIESKWISNNNGFLATILLQKDNINNSGLKAFYINDNDALSRHSLTQTSDANYPGYMTAIPLKQQNNFIYYAGPLDSKLLSSIDKNLASNEIASSELQDASSSGGFMQTMIKPFSKLLFLLLNFCYMITHSWGISIILLTILIRFILYPLNSWSFKSMAKMQELNPQLKIIQEKYKKDPNKLRMETALLYRNADCNPLAGCLGIPLQIPFFFGMFDLLRSTVQIRGVSFIPGWIDNLAAPDVLFSWSTPIFFFGTTFHLLPFLNGLLMFAQQKVTNMKQNPTKVSEQQKQMKNMGNIFAIVVPFIFYSMPSGLNIYYIFSTLFGVIQQWYINKKLSAKKIKRRT